MAHRSPYPRGLTLAPPPPEPHTPNTHHHTTATTHANATMSSTGTGNTSFTTTTWSAATVVKDGAAIPAYEDELANAKAARRAKRAAIAAGTEHKVKPKVAPTTAPREWRVWTSSAKKVEEEKVGEEEAVVENEGKELKDAPPVVKSAWKVADVAVTDLKALFTKGK